MKLVIIRDADGDSMSIIDEKFPPEAYLDINKETLTEIEASYDMDDLLCMLVSLNKSA